MQIWPFLRWHCISQTSFPGEVAKTIHKSYQILLMCWVDPMLSCWCLSGAKSLYAHIDHLLLVCFFWLLISIKTESFMSLNYVYFLITILITIFLCNYSHESLITYHSQEIVSWLNADLGSSVGCRSSVVKGHKICLYEKSLFQKSANTTLLSSCLISCIPVLSSHLSWLYFLKF